MFGVGVASTRILFLCRATLGQPVLQLDEGLVSVRDSILVVSRSFSSDLLGIFIGRRAVFCSYLFLFVHLGIRLALILEDRIPPCMRDQLKMYNNISSVCSIASLTEIGWSPWPHNFSLAKCMNMMRCKIILSFFPSYLGSSLEQSWLRSRTVTECEGAHGFCRSVVESVEHLVQSLVARCLEELFANLLQR